MTALKKVDGPVVGWMANWFGITPTVIRKDGEAGAVAVIVKDYLTRQQQAAKADETVLDHGRVPSKP